MFLRTITSKAYTICSDYLLKDTQFYPNALFENILSKQQYKVYVQIYFLNLAFYSERV